MPSICTLHLPMAISPDDCDRFRLVLLNVRAVSEANQRDSFGYSDLRSSLSIQPFEGGRFVRGGRYGISIDFGLEVIEEQSVCGAIFKSKFIDPTHEARAHDRLIVTRDEPFCKTDSQSRISDVASFGHATASAAKRLRSNALLFTNRAIFEWSTSRKLSRNGLPGDLPQADFWPE
jgi:hypothetical protein